MFYFEKVRREKGSSLSSSLEGSEVTPLELRLKGMVRNPTDIEGWTIVWKMFQMNWSFTVSL